MASSLFVYPTHLLTRTSIDARICVRYPSHDKTWGQFVREVNGWKLAFVQAGIHRVALHSNDLFDSAAMLFGAWAAKVTAVLPADTSEFLCQQLECNVVEACAGDFPASFAVPHLSRVETDQPCRDVFDETLPLVELFTSGSTGTPTRIPKRLRQLFVEIQSIEQRSYNGENGLDENVTALSTVSQQHIYGLLFYLLLSFCCARPVWGTRLEYPETLVDLIKKLGPCLWVASPAHLKRLPEDLDWAGVAPDLRAVFSSGGPLADDALRLCIALTQQSPIEFLGSSEAGGIAWRQRTLGPDQSICGAQWKALASVQWKCENGLLCIKSEQLFSSDWETTTDRIAANPDGITFTHLGRVDRIVKIEEKRVSLTSVENCLVATGLVSQAKAFQLDDRRHSFSVVAIATDSGVRLIRNEGKRALVAALRLALSKTVEAVCLPRYWRFTWSFPENSMGKVTLPSLYALFKPTEVQAVAQTLEPNHAVLVVSVVPGCPFFEGHFPNYPILPGIAQLQWIVSLGRRLFCLPAAFTGLRSLKFMRPIRPDSSVVCDLVWHPETASLEFTLTSAGDEPYAKGKLLFSSL